METERILLRHWLESDAEALFKYASDPDVGPRAGTVIHVPANVKHWHGAAKDSWFAHLAFEIPGENISNEWQEAVSDEEYNKIK